MPKKEVTSTAPARLWSANSADQGSSAIKTNQLNARPVCLDSTQASQTKHDARDADWDCMHLTMRREHAACAVLGGFPLNPLRLCAKRAIGASLQISLDSLRAKRVQEVTTP
jgi:hypothetical protein